MSAGASFVPSMISISNRNLIERMKKWGWVEKKSKGEYILMEAPSGTKVEVLRPGIHQGNPKETFDKILAAQQMTWTEFITPLEPDVQAALDYYISLSPEAQTEYRKELRLMDTLNRKFVEDHKRTVSRQANIAKRKRREAEKRARTFPVTVTRTEPKPVEPEPVQEEVPMEAPIMLVDDPEPTIEKVRVRTAGTTNRILMLLVESQQPMSLEALHEALPDARRESLSASCSNLMKYGVVERVKPGVYKIKDEVRKRGDVQVDIVARSGPPLEAVASQVEPVETPQPDGVSLPVPDSPEPPVVIPPRYEAAQGRPDLDELVNETLDLLFPEGFKARHLPLIDEWRKATVALMRDING